MPRDLNIDKKNVPNMIPWTIDAKDIGEINENDLVMTSSIREFLHSGERDRIFFVVAPKGIGKSLLLMYKRQLYESKFGSDKKQRKEEIFLIPKDMPVDRSLDITQATLTKEKEQLLEDISQCKQLWKFCLSISIIKNIIIYHKPKYLDELSKSINKLFIESNFSKDIIALIKNDNLITTGDIFISVLKLGYSDIIKVIYEQNNITGIIRNYIRSGVAVFIDNVDQSFEDYLRSKGPYSESSKNVWYTAQIGLIFAIYDLSSINGHIKVFVSIRKEAFQRMRKVGSLGLQISGEALDIAYTPNQLKEIFYKNINSMDERYLINKRFLKEDPLYSFLGLKDNKIESLNNIQEDIFCYIHRHSLKRPRDLMTIGKYLMEIDVKDRTQENIKRAINLASHKILSDYISEIYPFANIDYDRLFSLIPSNVLKKSDIIDICRNYNCQSGCNEDKCYACSMTHVFCTLYKFGLLGIIGRDMIHKEKFIQRFVQIGEIDYDERVLPNSEFYLTHPGLISLIEENNSRYNKKFEINSAIIIGDGYSWKSPSKKEEKIVPAKSDSSEVNHIDEESKHINAYYRDYFTRVPSQIFGDKGFWRKKINKDGLAEPKYEQIKKK